MPTVKWDHLFGLSLEEKKKEKKSGYGTSKSTSQGEKKIKED